MIGETSDALWGVMDIFPRTNFPDIRRKTNIRSSHGNLLIIPREGGSMVRFYLELAPGTKAKDVKLEYLHETATKIFSPYTMEFAHTYWWSAYSIGQRLVDNFSKNNRIFLTGDAAHTHSPKAGQGMNLSLQDGYNIGWKLAMVLNKECHPKLLETYVLERQKTAADLIAFDKELTALMKLNTSEDNADALRKFSEYFIKSAKYMAGLTTRYQDSDITDAKNSESALAKHVNVGTRFPSAQVIRFCDVRAVQLAQALKSDGHWRLMAFPGDLTKPASRKRLQDLADFLASGKSPTTPSLTPGKREADPTVEAIIVLHGSRVELEDQNIPIPEIFTPVSGPWQMRGEHFFVNCNTSIPSLS
jgi:phenol 2-monooxygenase (NADPH)